MSQLSQTLLQAAETIRLSSPEEGAVELLKQAGYKEEDARLSVAQHLMEKEAISALATAGVDVEQAVSMVKAANINLKDLVSYNHEPEPEHMSVDLLKQAAHAIDSLESEVEHLKEELEKAASSNTFKEVMPEQITKAASSGMFTQEDLLELQKMDGGTLTKIASAMDEPWRMGAGTGRSKPSGDPLSEWLMS